MAVDKRRVLFIGGIPSSMTEEVIRGHFSQYDTIVNVRIMKDRKTKGSKGYAFITVADHLKIPAILAEPQVIAGRTVDVQVASRRGEKEKWKEEQQKRKLYVSNIPSHVDNESLGNYFKKFGEVRNAFVIRDFATKVSLNYGYIEFSESDVIEKVFASGTILLDGTELVCLRYQGKSQDKKHVTATTNKKLPDTDGQSESNDQLALDEENHPESLAKERRISNIVTKKGQDSPEDGNSSCILTSTILEIIAASSHLNQLESNYGFKVKVDGPFRTAFSYSRAFVSAYCTYASPALSPTIGRQVGIPTAAANSKITFQQSLLSSSGKLSSCTNKASQPGFTPQSSSAVQSSCFKLFK
jgi:RNA recognition motif-containing protein